MYRIKTLEEMEAEFPDNKGVPLKHHYWEGARDRRFQKRYGVYWNSSMNYLAGAYITEEYYEELKYEPEGTGLDKIHLVDEYIREKHLDNEWLMSPDLIIKEPDLEF